MELQSTFVMAVIIGALLIADRLGGSDEVGRRMYQVALAIALGLAVISATSAFILEHGQEAGSVLSGEDGTDNNAVNRLVAASALQIGIAAIFLLYGLSVIRRWTTVGPAFVVGGVLLLLAGGTIADVTPLLFFVSENIEADRAVAIIHFLVVAAVAVLLVWYGLDRFERAPLSGAQDGGEAPPPMPEN